MNESNKNHKKSAKIDLVYFGIYMWLLDRFFRRPLYLQAAKLRSPDKLTPKCPFYGIFAYRLIMGFEKFFVNNSLCSLIISVLGYKKSWGLLIDLFRVFEKSTFLEFANRGLFSVVFSIWRLLI